MEAPLLQLCGLSKYYTSSQTVVMGLNQVSLTMRRGEFIAITGESGSGKSTLAHVIGGILPYENGELLLRGKPTSHFDGTDYERYRRDNISFISQSYGILVNCSVLENVVSALRLTGMPRQKAHRRAAEILKEVELWPYRRRRAAKLSSGQKQRLSIARALAKPAPILIADEPTGNLDPENSAKVIQLLANAARERLVILITHEFSEAAEAATRHIVLQDGQVVMDAFLRPFWEPAPEAPKKKRVTVTGPLSPYVARLQRKGRPIWSALVLLFFALTAFAVFAFMGTFIIALDDTATRIYDDSAFRNGEPTRIVAIRGDSGPMTQADYDTLLSVDYVEALERYGYVTDVNYGYGNTDHEVGYEVTYTTSNVGSADNPVLGFSSEINLTEDAPFLKTIPKMAGDTDFLTAGRLPENHLEVVMAGSEALIGTSFPVIIQDLVHWNQMSKLVFTVEVVGVTDYGSDLYFHYDIGRMFTHNYAHNFENWFYLPAYDLQGDVFRPSQYMYSSAVTSGIERVSFVRSTVVLGQEKSEDDVVLLYIIENDPALSESDPAYITPYHTSALNDFAEVSPEVFDDVIWAANSNQISITIADYAYTDRVLEALHQAGYIALSPYKEGSTETDPELAQERMQTLAICGGALLAVLLLQVLVLRALFNSQTEGYRLLANIGLVCATAERSLFLQLLRFTLIGQLLGAAAIWLCSRLEVERIVYVLQYLPMPYLAAIVGVHLAAAMLAAAWISRSVSRKVFPLAKKQFDLPRIEEVVV